MSVRSQLLRTSIYIVSLVGAASPASGDADPPTPGQGSVDSFYGSFTDHIGPLHYDSSTGNGFAGVGWRLDGWSEIQRAQPRHGTPRYDATDVYYLDGALLIPCDASGRSPSPSCVMGGTHSTQIESYTKIVFAANTWTIWSKDGKKAIYTALDPTTTYRWGIGSVTDTRGNSVVHGWWCDGTAQLDCYPDSVKTYPAGASTPTDVVQLYRELRSDAIQFGTGNAIGVTRYRLKTITRSVGGSLVSATKLAYASSASTSRSLLASVVTYGRDATLDASGTVTGGTSLPPTTLTYSAGASGFAASPTTWTDPLNYYLTYEAISPTTDDTRYTMMDMNGDGLVDRVVGMPGTWKVYLNTGSGFSPAATLWNDPLNSDFSCSGGGRTTCTVMDMNGDGLPDRVSANGASWSVYLNTGAGFATTPIAWNDPLASTFTYAASGHTFYTVADMNGDGLPDRIMSDSNWSVYLNTGVGFATTPIRWLGQPAGAYFENTDANGETIARTIDMNGDGLPDLVSVSGSTWMVSLNTGSSFAPRTTWVDPLASQIIYSVSGSTHYALVDMNGDGRPDRVNSTGATWSVYLNTGTAFSPTAITWNNPAQMYETARTATNTAGYIKATLLDMNGDGLPDQVAGFGGWAVHYGTTDVAGVLPDKLINVASSLGGSTSVTYASGTSWPSRTSIRPGTVTATSVTVADGLGWSATTAYSYSGALYDGVDRRFLGFHYSKAVQGAEIETWWQQDYGSLSKVQQINTTAANHVLLSSVQHVYTLGGGGSQPYTSLETGRWSYQYSPTGSGAKLRTYTGFVYNSNGDVTETDDYGDCDRSGDETTARTLYVSNAAAYILDRVVQQDTFAGAASGGACVATGVTGAASTEALLYYDGATFAAYPNPTSQPAPVYGGNTQTLAWDSYYNSYIATATGFDRYGNVTSTTDPLGHTTTTAYDATYHRFAVTSTNALAQSATAVWDPICGAQTSITDLNNQTSTQTYDALCRPLIASGPLGAFTTRSYVNLGIPAAQYVEVDTPSADGRGNQWTRQYFDGLGRTWRTISKGPTTTQNIYTDRPPLDGRGNPLASALPYYAGSAVPAGDALAYDDQNRIIKVTHADGAYQQTAYSIAGTPAVALVDSYDELDHHVQDAFDARGHRITHTEWLGTTPSTTTYAYDARGNLASTIDPAGNVTSQQVSSTGQTHLTTDPDMGTWHHEYDAGGRLSSQVDALGHRTELTYDALNRRLSKTTCVPAGSPSTCSNAGATSVTEVSWAYDQARTGYFNVGRLTTETDDSGTFTPNFDALGRIVQSTRTIDGQSYSFTEGFDAAGRSLWKTLPDGDTLGTPSSPRTYDGAGRPVAIPNIVTQARYDAFGRLIELDNANGTVATYTFDARRQWVNAINTTSGGTQIQNLGFTHDAGANITRKTSPFNYEQWSYSYDGLDRLTTATNATDASVNQTIAYDALGNITSSSLGTYAYPAARAARPHAVSSAGGNTYAYDANGNMISGGGRTISYNFDNLPTHISGSQFAYDADGTRLEKVNGATVTYYLGDAYEVTNGVATKTFSLAGLPIAQRIGSTTYWLHADHQASINVMTDSAGREVQRKTYLPYGGTLEATTSLAQSLGFTAQRQDETGLLYLHARYYDPQLGRFLTPDSIIPHGDIAGLNRYAYASNRPTNRADRGGHCDLLNDTGNGATVYFNCDIESNNSSLEAFDSTIDGNNNLIFGSGNTINGNGNHIYGDYNSVSGSKNWVYGNDNTVVQPLAGPNIVGNVVVGNFNTVKGGYNTVAGAHNTITGNDNFVLGSDNTIVGDFNWISSDRGNVVHGHDNVQYDFAAGTILLTTTGNHPWQHYNHAAMLWLDAYGVPTVLEKSGLEMGDPTPAAEWLMSHQDVRAINPIDHTKAQMSAAADQMYSWLVTRTATRWDDCSATIAAAYGLGALGSFWLTPDGLNDWARTGRLPSVFDIFGTQLTII